MYKTKPYYRTYPYLTRMDLIPCSISVQLFAEAFCFYNINLLTHNLYENAIYPTWYSGNQTAEWSWCAEEVGAGARVRNRGREGNACADWLSCCATAVANVSVRLSRAVSFAIILARNAGSVEVARPFISCSQHSFRVDQISIVVGCEKEFWFM